MNLAHCTCNWDNNNIDCSIFACIGAPRKTNTVGSPSHNQLHTTDQSTTTGAGLDVVTNQLSELSVTDGRGSTGAAEESDSSSSESSSDSESAVLERAKVEGVDLERLEAGPDGKAPLELVSQVKFMEHHNIVLC